jgi:hypothetical protein
VHGDNLTFLNILIEKLSFQKCFQRKYDLAIGRYSHSIKEVGFDNIVQLFRKDEFRL